MSSLQSRESFQSADVRSPNFVMISLAASAGESRAVSMLSSGAGISASHAANSCENCFSNSGETILPCAARSGFAIGICDARELILEWDRQVYPSQHQIGLDDLPHTTGEAGDHRSLGREGEYQRSPFRSGLTKHPRPHHLPQANVGCAAKGKNGCHGIDDEMIVKQR
jgi:hypothetical protein